MLEVNKPITWSSNPKRLPNPCSPIPNSKEIFLTEVQGENGLSTRDARLSNYVSSQAIMTYATNQDAFEDTTLLPILTKTILGGYMNETQFPNVKKIAPMRHPYLIGMRAKDIVNIVPREPIDVPDDNNWLKYNICTFAVNFESLDYPVTQSYSPGSDYNPNFIKWDLNSSSTKISISTGWYEFVGPSSFSGKPALMGMYLNQPLSHITATFYHVRRDQLFGAGNDLAILSPVYANIGQVNNAAFGGCQAEKIMIDSAEFQPWRDWCGDLYYNFRLNMIFSGWGWNNAPSPSGSIDPFRYVITGSRAWETFGLKSLFTLLNPL